jgi:hypothetical protein
LKAVIGGLDFDGSKGFEVDMGGFERVVDGLTGGQIEQARVDDHEGALEAHVFEIHADFAGSACAEPQVGGGELEGGVELGHRELQV